MGAALPPAGSSVLQADIGKGAYRLAFSAGNTGVRDPELAGTHHCRVKDIVDQTALDLILKSDGLPGQWLSLPLSLIHISPRALWP